MRSRCLLLSLALTGIAFWTGRSIDNGLALRPYMGYNTWYDFECAHINASNVMKLADAMVTTGLKSLGYTYLNIDDCWASGRDPTTKVVQPDAHAFPDGMKAVVDYVHSKGLAFGIYTDRGTNTCAGRPGSLGYEDVDAQTYASWGVDLVKEDSCNADSDYKVAFEQYGRMRDALNRTGRPMVFNLCGWHKEYAPVGAQLGNSWRISWDGSNWGAVVANARVNAELAKYAGPGGWNDPDFLLGSNPRASSHLTQLQSRMQFSLWAVMAAPLIVSANLLDASPFDLETYTNKEVLAVNQDRLGVQGRVLWGNCPGAASLRQAEAGEASKASEARLTLSRRPQLEAAAPDCQQIWARPLENNETAMVFVNYGNKAARVVCDPSCFGAAGYPAGSRPKQVWDLWQHKDLGPAGATLETTLNASGGFWMLRLSGVHAIWGSHAVAAGNEEGDSFVV